MGDGCRATPRGPGGALLADAHPAIADKIAPAIDHGLAREIAIRRGFRVDAIASGIYWLSGGEGAAGDDAADEADGRGRAPKISAAASPAVGESRRGRQSPDQRRRGDYFDGIRRHLALPVNHRLPRASIARLLSEDNINLVERI